MDEIKTRVNSTILENGAYNDICWLLREIERLQEDNIKHQYKLGGVMHFVDKWLDGDDLKLDEVERASKMRNKTLELIERGASNQTNLKNTTN